MRTKLTKFAPAAILATIASSAIAACTQAPDPVGSPALNCAAIASDPDIINRYIGQPLTAVMPDENAKGVRVIRPGMAVTMDYRTDRLNLVLDGNDIIIKIGCY